MASICFDESRNLIGCCRGRIFPYCSRAIYAIFIALLRGGDESEDVSDDQKMPKSFLKSSKRKKETKNTEKG